MAVVLAFLILFFILRYFYKRLYCLQSPDYIGRYERFILPEEEPIEEKYQYIVTKLGSKYLLRRFHPELFQIVHYCEYEYFDSAILPNGKVYEFWENGNIKRRGEFESGYKIGEWVFYDKNGKVEQVASYLGDEPGDNWLVQNSDSFSIHSYDEGVKVTSDEGYRKSKMIHEVDLSEQLPLFPGCDEKLPYLERKKCSDEKLLDFIYSNIKYPKGALQKGVEGRSSVSFIIERDGSISNINVDQEVNTDIKNELIRLVELMPKWLPGKKDNKEVRVQFNLPVVFKGV